jgi:monofunctional chorismate mutase
MADGPELCRELFVHRHRLGESSSSVAVRGACNATADLVELRTFISGLAGAILDCLGCGHGFRRGSCICICRSICAGEFGISRVCLGGIGTGRNPGDGLDAHAADDASPIIRDIRNVRGCECRGAEISDVGLCTGMLRSFCVSAAGGAGRTVVKKWSMKYGTEPLGEGILIKLLFILLAVSAIGCVALGEQASIQEQLAASREQIDKIDGQIVDLINQRAAIVERIGKIKAAAGLPITVPRREQEVLRHVAGIGASGPFPITRLKNVYSTLLEQMRDWEDEQQHPGIGSETLLRTSSSWNGAPYQGYSHRTPELSVLRIRIPPHQNLPWHTHPMPNVAFILSGEITVEEPSGKQRHFLAGEAVPETVNTVHRGVAGDQPVVLLVFYAGEKGMALAEQKP